MTRRLTPAEFAAALAATRMDPAAASTQAAWLVLGEQMSGYEAAHRVGLTEGAVNAKVRRLRARLPDRTCPHCGGTGVMS